MIIIQHIQTTWTKQSRGMPGAAIRNAVPRTLELPIVLGASQKIFIHKIVAHEQDNFRLQQKSEISEESDRYWSLSFPEDQDAVQVLFAYSYSQHGQPNRGTFRRPIFKLTAGQWGSMHINGRFTSYSGQWYRQHFVNIAHVDNPERNLFLSGKPDFYINKMVHLF